MEQIFFVPSIQYFVNRICTPAWVISRQLIDFHDLTYVIGGKGEYVIDGVSCPVGEGDLLYIPPGTWREAKTDEKDPMRLYAFNFSLYDVDFKPAKLPLPLSCHIGHDVKLEHLLLRIRQIFALREPTFQMQAAALFMEMICHLLILTGLIQGTGSDPRVQKAAAYVTEHISRHISTGEIGAAVGLHPGYLNKLTMKHTGKTVSRFITGIRVNMAEDAIAFEGITVSEAAERFGFSDIYHFSKVFKKYKGYPPSAAKTLLH